MILLKSIHYKIKMSTSFIVDPPLSLLPWNYHEFQHQQQPPPPLESDENNDEIKTIDLSPVLQTSNGKKRGGISKIKVDEEEEDDVTMNMNPFIKFSVKDLRAKCKALKLKTTGNRAELEDRLRETLSSNHSILTVKQ